MINNRLKLWSSKIILEDLLVKNPYVVPEKLRLNPTIVINISSKKVVLNKKNLLPIVLALELITGQTGVSTKAKYSLATYKLKQGMAMGLKITLHNSLSWSFLDKFLHIIFPNLYFYKQFKSLSSDKFGNFAIGLEDLNVFPELEKLRENRHILSNINHITGADIQILFNMNIGVEHSLASSFQLIKKLS